MPNRDLTPPDRPRRYQLRVAGRLSEQWAEWFAGLTITPAENDQTLLTGWVADQAALHGLLKKLRDLGLPLLSVNPLEPGTPADAQAAGDHPLKE